MSPAADLNGGVAGNGGSPLGDIAGDVVGGSSWHDGFGAGWDACAAFMARVVEDRRAAELDPANWTLWLDDEFDEDDHEDVAPAPCAACGGHGTIPCSWCDATQVERAGWSDDEPCGACGGSGDEPCPDCTEPDWGAP